MTKCSNCDAEKTPMWRKTLDNQTNKVLTLCNACGIYYKTKGCHRPRLLISKKNSLSLSELFDKLSQEQPNTEHDEDDVNIDEPQPKRRDSNNVVVNNDIKLEDLNIIRCSNCDNINTSIWRRDAQGKSICNACGLFYKKKGYHRAVKKNNDDMFLSVDENLIRFNKIKRRNRNSSSSGSDNNRHHHIAKHPKTSRSRSLTSEKTSLESSPRTPQIHIDHKNNDDDVAVISSNSSRHSSIVGSISPQPLSSNPTATSLSKSRSSSYSSVNQYPEPIIKFNANYSTYNNKHLLPALHPADNDNNHNSFPRVSNTRPSISNSASSIQLPPISSILNIDRSSF